LAAGVAEGEQPPAWTAADVGLCHAPPQPQHPTCVPFLRPSGTRILLGHRTQGCHPRGAHQGRGQGSSGHGRPSSGGGVSFGDIALSFPSSAGALTLPGQTGVRIPTPPPSPPACLRRQGPELEGRGGENGSFSERLGWETSSKEQLPLAGPGRQRGEAGAARSPWQTPLRRAGLRLCGVPKDPQRRRGGAQPSCPGRCRDPVLAARSCHRASGGQSSRTAGGSGGLRPAHIPALAVGAVPAHPGPPQPPARAGVTPTCGCCWGKQKRTIQLPRSGTQPGPGPESPAGPPRSWTRGGDVMGRVEVWRPFLCL